MRINTGQRKRIFLACLACLGILALIIALSRLDLEGKDVNFADDYEGLQIYVEYPLQDTAVNIWKGEECYYFFLPSGANGAALSFGNLRKTDSVTIGEHCYGQTDDISQDIQYGKAYEMQLGIGGKMLQAQPVVFLKSENIPAVFLETASGAMENIHADKAVKEEASMVIWDEEGTCDFRGGIEYVKTRGNSTFYEVDKKSYQIKLYQGKGLLGMEKEKKWLLLANAKDNSLIRNKLVYDFAAEYTDIPSIAGRHVDLYVNSDYVGNYFLCEKVEVSKNRLDIEDLEEKNKALNSADSLENAVQYVSEDGAIRALAGLKNPPDITGGYLVEKDTDSEFEQAKCAFRTESGQYYCVISPADATVEQVEYICNLFNEAEQAILQPDGVNPETGKHFSEYMDMESWIQKYLIDEVFADPDTPNSSTYFYKDADSRDPLIYSGPVWDYDRAFGGYASPVYYVDDPLQIGYRGAYAKSLIQHEEVMERVLEMYQDRFIPYVKYEIGRQIVSDQKKIKASAKMDGLRWQRINGYVTGWEANGEYIESFLNKKIEYLSEIWLEGAQYHSVTFLDYYGNVYDAYQVKHGEYLTTVPHIASYVAFFAGWRSVANGKTLDIRLPVLEDVVYRSDWIEMDVVMQNGLAMADMDLGEVDADALGAFAKYLKERQEKGLE